MSQTIGPDSVIHRVAERVEATNLENNTLENNTLENNTLENNTLSSTIDPEVSSDGQNHELEEYHSDSSSQDDAVEIAFSYAVDLVLQEAHRGYKPIYTRSLLEHIKLWVDCIYQETPLPVDQRSLQNLESVGSGRKCYKVWDWQGNESADAISVHYMSRVEIHPYFQLMYGKYSDQVKLLREYNEGSDFGYIDAPYAIQTLERRWSYEHNDNNRMEEYLKAILHTKGLWIKSSSYRQLNTTAEYIKAKCKPIKQVVCFGLGAINLNKAFYHSAIQYMAVFTIITKLNALYGHTQSNDRIKLILQDPNYEKRDFNLLSKLWPDQIDFVSDSGGLLALDSSTLVITAFLPVQMPLMQIVTDLFSERPENGPAAIICDIMDLDISKREYSFRERGSPAVARVLLNHYEKLEGEFKDHDLQSELMEDAYGKDWKKNGRKYWLNSMNLWTRMPDAGLKEGQNGMKRGS
jgi:hypothetical protein